MERTPTLRVVTVIGPGPDQTMSRLGSGSIPLYVHDLALHSRHGATTTVFSPPTPTPYEDIDVQFYVPGRGARTATGREVANRIAASPPDVVVVQQYLSVAVGIARGLPHVPVLLVRHNDYKPCNWIRRAWRMRQMNRLAGLIFVSQHQRQRFVEAEGDPRCPTHIVHNGLPLQAWLPRAERQRVVAFAGRCRREKGVLEAAQACRAVLPRYPGWRAAFALGEGELAGEVEAELAQLGPQASVRRNVPFPEAKAMLEGAAIALAPSTWAEPFGRAAIEAMAGGAALITTHRGGLGEVVGDSGLVLDVVTPESVAQALERLIEDAGLRASLSSRGRERVRARFDIRATAARFDSVLEAAVLRWPANPVESSLRRISP